MQKTARDAVALLPSGTATRLIVAEPGKNKRNYESKQDRTEPTEYKTKINCIPHSFLLRLTTA